MKPTDTDRDAALRAVLRAGDPAAEPVAFDAERMRRQVLAGPAPAPMSHPWLALAAGLAGLVALLVGYLRAPELSPPTARDAPAREAQAMSAGSAAEPASARQFQFETSGGTRIIWVVSDDRLP